MEFIIEEMSIQEIIQKFPQTSQVFIKYGLFCVGCAASSIETLKQGILGHGISESQFNEILKELNETAKQKPSKKSTSFEITDNAINEIVKIKTKNSKLINKTYLRISAGSNEDYNFEFTDTKDNSDIIFYKKKLKIIIDKTSFENLQNIKIDFKKTQLTTGFTFEKN